MKNGLKFSHFKRNKKLEKQMRKEIIAIINRPEYRELPMLIMNSLKIEYGVKGIMIDISNDNYYFVFARCLLRGDKKND